MPRAAVRFFCTVAPSNHRWGKRSIEALRALDASGMGVRAVPILGHMMQFYEPGYEAWQPLDHLFSPGISVEDRFLNVICAPPRFDLGRRATLGEIAPKEAASEDGQVLAAHVTGARSGDDAEVAYEPETALNQLITPRVGVTNICLTEMAPAPLPSEIETLRKCAAVLVPTERDAQKLRGQFVAQVIVEPGKMETLVKVARQCLEASDDGDVCAEGRASPGAADGQDRT